MIKLMNTVIGDIIMLDVIYDKSDTDYDGI